MKSVLLPLLLAASISPAVLTAEAAAVSSAADVAVIISTAPPAGPAASVPGEKTASEDAILRDFHVLDLGLNGGKVYRSASPVRELVKRTSSAPDDAGTGKRAEQIMEHLKELGIRTIISLEDPSDAGKGNSSISVAVERAAARTAGITFLSHPMRNSNFRETSHKDILAWLRGVEKDIRASAKNGGVLFHCAAGHDRTGLAAAYLRVTVNKWPVERAIAEMRELGHNWVKYSSNGGISSWHEEFLKDQFGGGAGK